MLIKFNLDDATWDQFQTKTNTPGDTMRELVKGYVDGTLEPLSSVMGAEEAGMLWDLSPAYIKNLCARGEVKAAKIGKTWVIDRNQPNPKKEL